jgi:Sec-independent protein translocase protein TatA
VSGLLKQSYLRTIRAFPGGWDAMCAALGMTRDALENRVYERRGQDVTVQTALMMQSFANTTAIAEAIAVESGGVFVKLPAFGVVSEAVATAKFQELVEEVGELSKEFRTAMADHKVNGKEQVRINDVIDRINRTTGEFRALVKQFYCHETAAQKGSSN